MTSPQTPTPAPLSRQQTRRLHRQWLLRLMDPALPRATRRAVLKTGHMPMTFLRPDLQALADEKEPTDV